MNPTLSFTTATGQLGALLNAVSAPARGNTSEQAKNAKDELNSEPTPELELARKTTLENRISLVVYHLADA